MNPAVDVSVIIPTYNRSHLLLRLLQSLERKNFTGTYDVVVDDDGSNDDTRNVLSQYQPRCPYPLKILRQPNAGPGPARNRGIGVAQGRILAFIDDDHIARPEWMSEISDIPEGPRSAGQCGRNVSLPGRSATSRYDAGPTVPSPSIMATELFGPLSRDAGPSLKRTSIVYPALASPCRRSALVMCRTGS